MKLKLSLLIKCYVNVNLMFFIVATTLSDRPAISVSVTKKFDKGQFTVNIEMSR